MKVDRRRRPPLSVAQILAWAEAHRARTGRWPTSKAGAVPECPGQTWAGVDMALRCGHRGLPGGDGLAVLLRRERGVRGRPGRPLSANTELAAELRAQGLSLAQVSQRMGISRQAVHYLLRRAAGGGERVTASAGERPAVGAATPSIRPAWLYGRLLHMNGEAFEAGHYAAACHALQAALHCAFDAGDEERLVQAGRLAREQAAGLHTPTHDRADAAQAARPAYAAALRQAEALTALLRAGRQRERAEQTLPGVPETCTEAGPALATHAAAAS
jgi:hypothetical protein